MHYDYLIVGAGLYGAVFAAQMKKQGKKCLVIEKMEEKKMTEDQKEIFDNLSGPLLTFAKAVDNISHTSAEKSRQNNKSYGRIYL